MTRTVRALLALTLATAAVPAAADPRTVIDSFTHPYPLNPWLAGIPQPILFIGDFCEGLLCPPSPVATNPNDYAFAFQSDVTGAIGPYRVAAIHTLHAYAPGTDRGVLHIEPTNGESLRYDHGAGGGFVLDHYWGDTLHSLGLDLRADGSDRFEIEILEGPVGPNAIHGSIHLGRTTVPYAAVREFFADGPGNLSVPYEEFADLDPIEDDVAYVEVTFFVENDVGANLVIGEFRTSAGFTPAAPQTWGRLKAAYRR